MDELVFLSNEETIYVSSLTIAEKFEKNHRDVLRDIRNVLEQLSKGFGARNFALSSYRSLQSGRPQGKVRTMPFM